MVVEADGEITADLTPEAILRFEEERNADRARVRRQVLELVRERCTLETWAVYWDVSRGLSYAG